MIFYFSGTGNSLHIAKKIAEKTQDKIVQISEDSMEEQMEYSVLENEVIGFVFPVYWYGIPTIVEKYIENLVIRGYNTQYVYAVATYGLSAGSTLDDMSKLLRKKNYALSGKFGVRMVDNYVVGYNLVDEAKQKEILAIADIECNKITEMILTKETREYIKKGILSRATPIVHSIYKKADHTKKFYTTDLCNGCGLCAKECPCNVITMVNQKPNWNGECTHCLKCINQCPKVAIQYGKGTLKRRRYYNHQLS